jgi:hypothetical protein
MQEQQNITFQTPYDKERYEKGLTIVQSSRDSALTDDPRP